MKNRIHLRSFFVLLAIFALSAPLSKAQTYVMQVADTEGGVELEGYENWIEILSFFHEFGRNVDLLSIGGVDSNRKLTAEDFVITMAADAKALPALWTKIFSGDSPEEIVIEKLNIAPGGGPHSIKRTMRLEFEGVWKMIKYSGGSGDEPIAELVFVPTKMKIITYDENGEQVAEAEKNLLTNV